MAGELPRHTFAYVCNHSHIGPPMLGGECGYGVEGIKASIEASCYHLWAWRQDFKLHLNDGEEDIRSSRFR